MKKSSNFSLFHLPLIELLLLFLFTIISVIIRGYEYGLGNMIHYLTYVNYSLHPNLYPYDYLLKTHTIPYTIYISFLKYMPAFMGSRQIPMFILYIFFLYCFYLGLFSLIKALFANKQLAWVVLLFFIAPVPVGGSSIATVEKELDPRFIAEAFLFPSLYFLSRKQTIPSAILAALGFLFHPLTMLVYPLILIFLFLKRQLILKEFILASAVFSIIASPMLLAFLTGQSYASEFIDTAWKPVLIERMQYIFALHWAWYDLVLIALIPVFFFLYPKLIKTKSIKIHSVVTGSLIAGFILFLINIASDILSLRIPLQLQLTRNMYLPVVFALIYLISFIFMKTKGKLRIIFLTCIFLATCITGLQNRQADGILWKRPLSDYEKTAIWSRHNTSINDIFLVPPETTGFRFWSERSVVNENKEGGDSLYDRKLAMEWDKREDMLKNYYHLNPSRLKTLETNYHMNYVVTTQTLSYPVTYSSGEWKVYKL